MGPGNRSRVIAGAAVVTLAIAGCGSSGGTLLSSAQSSQLTGELTQAKNALNNGNCLLAADALSNLISDVNQLNGVNATLVSSLRQGIRSAQSLASKDCPTGATTTTSTNTTTTATDTTTTATVTTTASDTATDTTPTQTTVSTSTISPITSTDGGVGAVTTTPATTPDTTPAPDTNTTPDSGGGGLGASGGGSVGSGQ